MTFEEYAAQRVPVLVRTAAALCSDVGLAEDLVQEVLIKVHQRWQRIDAMDARDAYVRRMLVNEFVSWRRKWSRVAPAADVEPPQSSTDPAGAYADGALLRAEISRLPPRRQAVLTLRYYCGLTDIEIAQTLGCRASTVRSLASRALSALRIEPSLQDEFAPAPRVQEGHPT